LSQFKTAGMKRIVPAAFFVLTLLSARSVIADVPAEKPLDVPKPRVAEAPPTAFEKAAARVARDLRSTSSYPATSDAVEFALYLYAIDRRAGDLELADRLARRLRDQGDSETWPGTFFQIAGAGGNTLAEVEQHVLDRRRTLEEAEPFTTAQYARYVQDLFERARLVSDLDAVRESLLSAATFFERRTRGSGSRYSVLNVQGEPSESLTDHLETVRVAYMASSLSGSSVMRDDTVRMARELVRRFWIEDTERFRAPEEEGAGAVLRLNASAALLLWEVGYVGGDTFLKGRGQRVLNSILDEAVANRESAPAAGLAAARIGRYPVQMVLIGLAGDRDLGDLRRASYALFEPRRLLINLDPSVDGARLEELMYPPELAPVLFICVESICSRPIQTPDDLQGQVKHILDLSAGVPE
jgi:hypothetical protein